jgi:polyvinyl alcohol dehydrogenase (cytochrome)
LHNDIIWVWCPLLAWCVTACSSGRGENLDTIARQAAIDDQPGRSPQDAGEAVDPSSFSRLGCSDNADDWPMFGHDVCNNRSTRTRSKLSPGTAARLGVRWEYDTVGDVSATPMVVGQELYFGDWSGAFTRLDSQTGALKWSKQVVDILGIGPDDAGQKQPPPPDGGVVDPTGPLVVRNTPVLFQDSVIFGVVRGLFIGSQSIAIVAAVDRVTGALKWQTVVDQHPAAYIAGSPVIDGGRVYVGVSSAEEFFTTVPGYPCCTFRGSIVALDAGTGHVLWKTPTIEDSAYFQADGTTPSGYAGAAVWSTPAVDRKRQSLYVTTGNNYAKPEGSTTLPPGNHLESVLSLDLGTGAIKWASRMTTGDVWTVEARIIGDPDAGPDFDFGAGPNLYPAEIDGVDLDVVGAGQKSGIYWALDADDGSVLWKTQVGPGGHLGGIHWGTAVDRGRVFAGCNDDSGGAYVISGNGSPAGPAGDSAPDSKTVTVGSWAALQAATGQPLWQVADPALTLPFNQMSVNGPVSVSNGVLFGGSMDAVGTMFAFDAETGAKLWSFQSGGTVYGGPAIAHGLVYWGSGYPKGRLGFGTPSHKLYAFGTP